MVEEVEDSEPNVEVAVEVEATVVLEVVVLDDGVAKSDDSAVDDDDGATEDDGNVPDDVDDRELVAAMLAELVGAELVKPVVVVRLDVV